MDLLSLLPEECVSEIISRTSPRDACRCLAVSRGFKLVADSDAVWEKFLPSDYWELIISRSVVSPQSLLFSTTKKQLYFTPLLLDGGKLSFTLDKDSGKKCYMLQARELAIIWGETPLYWIWTTLPESRFSEVALLLEVCWFDIKGRMKTIMLSPDTTYVAHLIFQFADNIYGFESVSMKTCINVVGERDDSTEIDSRMVYFEVGGSGSGSVPGEHNRHLPQNRNDGWMEIELGEFFNGQGDGAEVEMRIMEHEQLNWKRGLYVEGIELRPKADV